MTTELAVGPELRLQVKYKGPDADRGRMLATQVGPAIFAIGDALGRTSRLLYGDEQRVQLQVRADFEHASFGIEFFAVSPGASLIPPLSLEEMAQIAAILGLVGGVPGMVSFVRWLSRRRIKEIEPAAGDQYVIHVEGDHTVISADEYKVFTDPIVRRNMRALVEPLAEDRITGLEVQTGNLAPVEIPSVERDYFDIRGLPSEELGEDRSTQIIEVLAPNFQPGNKWYVGQGDARFFVAIEDEEFLGKVARREYRFGKEDALKVEMVVEVTRDDQGRLHYDRRVARVLDVLRASEDDQIDLL